jgi:hypothetical protein
VRVTKQMILQKMRTLNAVLKRPELQWDPGAKGNEMNVGHLHLEDTGFGMRLVEICSPGGAERSWSDTLVGSRQTYDYLVGVLHGISLRNELLYRETTGVPLS